MGTLVGVRAGTCQHLKITWTMSTESAQVQDTPPQPDTLGFKKSQARSLWPLKLLWGSHAPLDGVGGASSPQKQWSTWSTVNPIQKQHAHSQDPDVPTTVYSSANRSWVFISEGVWVTQNADKPIHCSLSNLSLGSNINPVLGEEKILLFPIVAHLSHMTAIPE